jgi:hypothetical protein
MKKNHLPVLIFTLGVLVTSCDSNKVFLRSGKAVTELWKIDTCGTRSYRYALCDYFLKTSFVSKNFKTEKDVLNFFGTPDSIRYVNNEDLKNIFIYEYVVIGVEDCSDPDQHRLIQSSMEIYFYGETKKIRSVSFPLY